MPFSWPDKPGSSFPLLSQIFHSFPPLNSFRKVKSLLTRWNCFVTRFFTHNTRNSGFQISQLLIDTYGLILDTYYLIHDTYSYDLILANRRLVIKNARNWWWTENGNEQFYSSVRYWSTDFVHCRSIWSLSQVRVVVKQ